MSDSTERNCDKCIHHTSGECDSWDCKMQTVEDVKKEAVNEYTKSVVAELEKELKKGNIAIDFGEFRVFEIVKQGAVRKEGD